MGLALLAPWAWHFAKLGLVWWSKLAELWGSGSFLAQLLAPRYTSTRNSVFRKSSEELSHFKTAGEHQGAVHQRQEWSVQWLQLLGGHFELHMDRYPFGNSLPSIRPPHSCSPITLKKKTRECPPRLSPTFKLTRIGGPRLFSVQVEFLAAIQRTPPLGLRGCTREHQKKHCFLQEECLILSENASVDSSTSTRFWKGAFTLEITEARDFSKKKVRA